VRRLAFFSPLPPSPTGIADYSADVLEILAPRYHIDAYTEDGAVEPDRLPPSIGVLAAAAFSSRRGDDLLPVYQVGNAPAHDFVHPILQQTPGLLVLHDLVLHHARGRVFLEAPEVRAYRADPSSKVRRQAAQEPLDRYRASLEAAYPGKGERLASVQLGTVGTLLPYAYPFFEEPVRASRLTLVHNAYMARAIGEAVPEARVRLAPMPITPWSVSEPSRREVRARLGFGEGDTVVLCLGLLTREKQLETVARAVARAAAWVPHLRLLLVGSEPPGADLEGLLTAHLVRSRSVLTGRVPFAELGAHIEAADIAVHLRYPTARETSAALLRLLAQGRPTIVTDLQNLAEIPRDAVLRADASDEEGDVVRALLDLAKSPAHRERLGARARSYVASDHAPARTLAAYESAIEEAVRP
jgi:glycosyltransferase involved in cell wall biosynthesis